MVSLTLDIHLYLGWALVAFSAGCDASYEMVIFRRGLSFCAGALETLEGFMGLRIYRALCCFLPRSLGLDTPDAV